MMLKLNYLYPLFLAACIFSSCAKEQLYPEACAPDENLYIYGNYTNYIGESPSFTIDEAQTSENLNYGTASAGPHIDQNTGEDRIRIRIPDISIKDNTENKSIKSFIAEELKNGTWQPTDEVSISEEFQQQNMAVVMVLDMSTSLGNDVSQVKQNAINFATKFLNYTDNHGYIGLVLFSQDTASYSFTNDLYTIQYNINNYTNYKNATMLYGAMRKGLKMLENTTLKVDGKALIAFTDGTDNATHDPTTVKNEILSSSITRYTIGLEGNSLDYDEGTLRQLASSPENFANADNISLLQDAFDKVLNQITSIIIVNYDRVPQKLNRDLDPPVSIRFKFLTN